MAMLAQLFAWGTGTVSPVSVESRIYRKQWAINHQTRMNDGGLFLRDALLNASKLVEFSLILLCLMFAWTLGHSAEQIISYLAAKRQTRSFVKDNGILLKRSEWKSVLVLGERQKNSHVAIICAGFLREFEKDREHISPKQALQVASQVARIARNELREQIRRGVNGLSAISKTAPLVGVFGTCIGILDSFRGYDGNKYGYLAFLATNLAEALVPTTVGLLVGVTATWGFDWRNDRLAAFDAEMEIALLELGSLNSQKSR